MIGKFVGKLDSFFMGDSAGDYVRSLSVALAKSFRVYGQFYGAVSFHSVGICVYATVGPSAGTGNKDSGLTYSTLLHSVQSVRAGESGEETQNEYLKLETKTRATDRGRVLHEQGWELKNLNKPGGT
jgi:hypothetical protein